MIERHVERFAPVVVAVVALLTGGAWLAAHGGPPYQGGPQYPQYPNQQPPQPPYPNPQPPPPEPPPRTTGCADCAGCADCMSGCDVGDCDVGDCDLSGCGDCDCSGIDCTLARARTGSTGFLVLLLPLALLDAWRRRAILRT